MEYSKQVICERCKKSVPINEIKYIQNIKNKPLLLCSICRGEKEEKISKSITIKRGYKRSYNCLNCGYDFKSNELNMNCPYCGKRDKIKENKIISTETIFKDL